MNTTTKMELVSIDKLIPYINNARTHSPEQVNKLRSSLREFGFINPVIIDKDYNVIAGHGRILAAREERMLSEVKESIINAYEIKTGLSRSKLSHLMDDETWMNAKKAMELGFADGMLEDEKKSPSPEAYAFSSRTVERSLMNKLCNKAKAQAKPEPEVTGRSVDELMDRLNLMKY